MERYEHKKVEEKWREKWAQANVYKTTQDVDKEKFYILDMFPYPSGEGLHVGHPKGYIATDIISRYKKMQNFNVLHPMGWDAFGLPAEQHALKNKIHPRIGTNKNIATFKKQLEKISLNYDWEREIATTDPEFYKWTQWTFIQMYKKGLVYQSNEPINWCPSCKTGLANEDLEDGACERCGTPIEKKKIPQWVIKITDYADCMLTDLDKLDWQEHIKELQRNWIGRSEGVTIEFGIKNEELKIKNEEISNVVLIHGCPSDEEKAMDTETRTYNKHWLPWIKEKLEQKNIRVDFPLMPHPWKPSYEDHKKEFEKLDINENSILIGTSCGTTFLLRWLGETKQKVKSLIMVAPWHEPKLDKKRKINFYNFDIDESINDRVENIVIFTSDNDYEIGMKSAKLFEEKFDAKVINIKGYGHYLENQMGTIEFPELLNEILDESKVVLMHGKNTNPQEKWYPWLATEMKNNNISFTAPILPNADEPHMDEWLSQLEDEKPNENTILIGHSRGGVAVLRWLEEQPKGIKVKKVILVAANYAKVGDKHTKENTYGFYTDEGYDFEEIKKHCDDFVILHSRDDELVSFESGEKNAEGLDAKFLIFDDRGHFGGKLQKQEIPELLDEIIDSHLSRQRRVQRRNGNGEIIKAFTTRPDTLYGVTYMVLAPEHELVNEMISSCHSREGGNLVDDTKVQDKQLDPRLREDDNCGMCIKNVDEVVAYQEQAQAKTEIERTAEGKEKTGVQLDGVKAVNPVSGEEIPIFIADYVLADYGTGAIMAVPAHDERDFEFAQKYNIDIKEVMDPLFIDKTKNSSPRKDLEFIERDVITAIVKHWEDDTYLTLQWKKVDWTTFITGGIEDGQTSEEAARAEILEETGYKNLKLVKELGTSHSKFFHNPKNVNRFAHFQSFYFELENDERDSVSDEEKAKHNVVWMEKGEIEEVVEVSQCFIFEKVFTDKVFTGTGIMINSGEFDGISSEEAGEKITEKAGGKMTTSYKLRDWVFSRQRYWGEPIPLIHCEKCGVVAVPEDELPLILPEVKSYEPTGTGESPLVAIDEWVNTQCPECDGPAKRETNTMPQWAGSSWYYLRYIDPKNDSELVDRDKEKYWSPVDFYVGGAEHATRHLIYARFWHKFLYDIGVVAYDEPFSKLQTVGLIMAEDGRKMSKRWGNVINPDDVIDRFGSDTFRLYEMFMGPFDASVAWSTDSLVGPRKFLEKIWKMYHSEFTNGETSKELQKTLHKTIKKVGEDIEEMKYNTAISAMMVLVNQLEKEKSISADDFGKFLTILSPFAPHMTQELWDKMGNKTFLIEEKWPKYDEKYLIDDEIELVVQVNGKVRDKIIVNAGLSENDAKEKALKSEKVQKHINKKEIKKVIFVQDKLISIVV